MLPEMCDKENLISSSWYLENDYNSMSVRQNCLKSLNEQALETKAIQINQTITVPRLF